MNITDTAILSDNLVVSDSGYIEAVARTARTGVQKYLGLELGRSDLDVVNVYRDESEVFSKRSLNTFSKLPITNDHPGSEVNSENWRDLAVGTTGDEVLRDGEYLKIGIKITDASAVKAVQSGKRELSVGYAADIVWQDGIAPDGTPYQAVQKNIVANHIAIVDSARAGKKARIGDSAAWGASPINENEPKKPGGNLPINNNQGGRMAEVTLKTVVLGDKAVQVSAADAAIFEQFKADSAKALKDAEVGYASTIAAKDGEIGELKVKLKAAEDAAKVDVDALVAARSDLVSKVKAIDSKIEISGKSDADLRKAAVASKLGDEMIKDAGDAEIIGMFKAIAKDAKPSDPVADAFLHGVRRIGDAAASEAEALNKSVHDMNAWRNQGSK